MAELYDRIGVGYRLHRQPDPRIAAAIVAALGDAGSVVNVGAGCGSYEPRDRRVIAVEPSLTMLRQRPADAAPALRASGDALPFADASVDAALAVLTLHHWPDQRAGVRELARVARRRVVILTWDPYGGGFWLTDYLPEILVADRRIFPPLDWYAGELGAVDVLPVPIPHDCRDGFLGAYWRQPEAYFDAGVRSAISCFDRVDPSPALDRLRRDLDSGEWESRYGALRERAELDIGYRLVVAMIRSPRPSAAAQPS